MKDRIPSEIGEEAGDEKIKKQDKKTKWVYPKKPDHESELDKILDKIAEENKVLREQWIEEEKKRRDEAFKNAIEGITKAFSGGDPEKARQILEEFVETEGAKIARERGLERRACHKGRGTNTIFFRKGS